MERANRGEGVMWADLHVNRNEREWKELECKELRKFVQEKGMQLWGLLVRGSV